MRSLARLLAWRAVGEEQKWATVCASLRLGSYRFISRDSLPLQIPHMRSNHTPRGFSLQPATVH